MRGAAIRVDRFDPADLGNIAVQAAQPELAAGTLAQGRQLSATGRCFTIRDARGAILFCGGALETHGEYCTLWSALAQDAGRALVAITRRVRWFVADLPHARVDAMVRGGFDPAHRWMGMLGFAAEARLGDYFADGEDAVVYRLMREPR